MNGLTPYLALFSARFRMLLQYRSAAAAGLATQVFWGLIRMMIFDGFYRSTTEPQPLSYPEVVTYIWLGQATLGLVMMGIDLDTLTMVRSGGVVYELLRPLDLYGLWYARSLAARIAPTLLRAVPMLLLAGLFLGLQRPTPAAGAGWLAATAMAMLLSAAVWTLASISMLWTVSGEGIVRILPSVACLFSGLVVPLPLLPDWLRPAVEVLPFAGLMDLPFRVYLGHVEGAELAGALARQAAWTAVLVLAGRWVLGRGVRRMVVQGG